MTDRVPTCRELLTDNGPTDNALNLEVLASRVEKVLALHRLRHPAHTQCASCGGNWPCPTVRLLDGEGV